MIHLVIIDEENWRTPLSVSKEQESYVANTTTILARAYAYRNARSKAFLIQDDETPVGIVLYYDNDDLSEYILSELFIDKRFQRKGYGKVAMELVLEQLKNDGKYNKVVLCYIEGNHAAKTFYENFGFVQTDCDDDEIIMELKI